MTKSKTKVHSRWECKKCPNFTYEAPLAGQTVLAHRAVEGGKTVYHKPKRTWQSKYDKMSQ